jgi:hypothetical protein
MEVRKTMKIFFIVSIVLSFFLWPDFSYANDTPLVADAVPVYLDVRSANATLFSGQINVSPCGAIDSTPSVASGYCAVLQSGLTSAWTDFGGSKFLDSIEGIGNDYDNSQYWMWFSDLEYGETSLDQHILFPNEHLLVTIGRMPLKIDVSGVSPSVGSSIEVSISQFGFDASWDPVWTPSAGSVVRIVGSSGDGFVTNDDGRYLLPVGSLNSFQIYGSKNGFLDSRFIEINPIEGVFSGNSTLSTTTDEVADASNPGSGGNSGGGNPGGGSGGDTDDCEFDIVQAVNFLLSDQDSDGSFNQQMYSDWIAIALASQGNALDSVAISARNVLRSYMLETNDSFSQTTDFERHAMALMALNINPYTGTPFNYIQAIVERFDGEQIGRSDLINDDIFAIFPLLKAGYRSTDPIIQSVVDFVVSEQNTDGSWVSSVDLTAAAIQGLSMVESLPGVREAIDHARGFLVEQQESDGGFGSDFSTSWSMQAISTLGESQAAWVRGGKTPYDSLCESQQEDGGVGELLSGETTRLWATAYAIPAVAGKPWSRILHSFRRQEIEIDTNDDRVEDQSEDEVALLPQLPATTTPPTLPPAPFAVPVVLSAGVEESSEAEIKSSPIETEIEDNVSSSTKFRQTANVISSGLKISKHTFLVGAYLVGAALVAFYLFYIWRIKKHL